MKSQRNVKYTLVCNDDTALVTTGTINDYADLTDGDMAIVDEAGTAYADGDSSDTNLKLRFAVRNGTKLLYSPFFKGKNVTRCHHTDNTAAVEQVVHIGYVGSGTYSIDYANETIYRASVDVYENDSTSKGQNRRYEGVCKSGTAATQYSVTKAMSDSLINNSKKVSPKPIKVEMINSGAQASAMDTATAAVVNGSKYVVFSENMTAITTDGAIVRFGTSGAGTAPCYKIVSNDGGAAAARVYKLDLPYQGATAAAFAAATLETVTEGPYWGIQITGLTRTATFSPGKVPYSMVSFKAYKDGFDATITPVTYSTDMVWGEGVGYQVIEDELFTTGIRGNEYRKDWLAPATDLFTTVGTAYNIYTLEFTDDNPTGGFNAINTPIQIALAYPNTESNLKGEDITAVLDDFMTVTP